MTPGGAIAPEKVNVLTKAGDCSVTILPQRGGKIASICVGGSELLQAPLAPYADRTRTMAFDASDASGWDECLPSVAECSVETAGGTALIPDHGDLWRVAWTVQESEQVAVSLRGECFSLPLLLERTVTLRETGSEARKSWRIDVDYMVTNVGSHASPWSWAAHPLFAAEAGDRIVLPSSIDSLRVEGSGGGRLGKSGDTATWPIATLANGSRANLSVAQPPESAIGDKLFAGPLKGDENWCVLERPKAGFRIKVSFDASATPYLGLWICYGGWPDGAGPKQNCVAMEPATAPVDSLAETGPWSRVLAAGESFAWPMVVEIETIPGENRHA
jgi:galactose mutarotase-like enzyme